MRSFIDHCRKVRLVRYVVTIASSVFVTLVIVSVTMNENEVEGCERRQPIFEELARTIQDAGKYAESEVESAVFEARARRVRDLIVDDCHAAYPPPIPFVK